MGEEKIVDLEAKLFDPDLEECHDRSARKLPLRSSDLRNRR